MCPTLGKEWEFTGSQAELVPTACGSHSRAGSRRALCPQMQVLYAHISSQTLIRALTAKDSGIGLNVTEGTHSDPTGRSPEELICKLSSRVSQAEDQRRILPAGNTVYAKAISRRQLGGKKKDNVKVFF